MSAPNGHAGSSSTGRVDGTENAPAVVNNLSTQLSTERLAAIIAELAVPFAPSLIEWRVTNTTKDKARGQVIPYADQRAYIDRLTALVTPAGWTRKYSVHTSANFERSKDQKTIAKVLVTCELTIFGIGSHSATGEAWSDDENASTSAEAQAFKRAAACFGLGRYLYYFRGIWVDLDAHKRPKKLPKLPLWATPDGWRKGMRPDNESQANSESAASPADSPGSRAHDELSDDLVVQIERMAQPLGKALYRGILKSLARVWNPHEIKDAVIEKRVLEHMLAADRGLNRLKAALEKSGPEPLRKILAFLNLQSLERIDNLELLKKVVVSLESVSPKA